jgi:hypothetical protein
VLSLLGEGVSNAEIGARLVISPRTAERHVGRILRKLALKSRAQAAAYALRGSAHARERNRDLPDEIRALAGDDCALTERSQDGTSCRGRNPGRGSGGDAARDRGW